MYIILHLCDHENGTRGRRLVLLRDKGYPIAVRRTFDLLIVDDDPDQERITRQLMRELHVSHRCHFVANGAAALKFLHQIAPFEHAPRPQLVLLDLNMPGMNGCEVLREVKDDPQLRTIPIIILSSSDRA